MNKARSETAPDPAAVRELFETLEDTLDASVCFHDRLRMAGVSGNWSRHLNPACLKFKETADSKVCIGYCMHEVHRALAGNRNGRVNTCPAGLVEIAAPVYVHGSFAGVLFAGPWAERGKDPKKVKAGKPPPKKILKQKLVMLRAGATELGRLLEGSVTETSRQREIVDFIESEISRPLGVSDLAEHLSLSASRTGHVVRELFGVTFPDLVNSIRLKHGAFLMISTDLRVSEVAEKTGYPDQNYFSRLFSRHFKIPPREYRKRYAVEA